MCAEIKVLSFAQAVCKRPKMYTENGTPEEVLLVLMGFWIAGRDKLKDDPDFQSVHKLAEKYSEMSFCPPKILEGIRQEGFTEDDEILGRMIDVTDVAA